MTLKRMVGIDEWGEEPIYMHITIGARMGQPQNGKKIPWNQTEAWILTVSLRSLHSTVRVLGL